VPEVGIEVLKYSGLPSFQAMRIPVV